MRVQGLIKKNLRESCACRSARLGMAARPWAPLGASGLCQHYIIKLKGVFSALSHVVVLTSSSFSDSLILTSSSFHQAPCCQTYVSSFSCCEGRTQKKANSES